MLFATRDEIANRCIGFREVIAVKQVKAALAAGLMAVLILDNRCALRGAAEGIELCVKTVIPSLFPFFVLSSILTASATGLAKPLAALFGVTPNAGGALISGLLGGYPVGARSISQACAEGSLTPQEAQRLLPICNQCGPAFIFGITGSLLGSPVYSALIWGLHILSAILVARLLLPKPRKVLHHPSAKMQGSSLAEAMTQSIRSIATVCGWIVLFRVMFSFSDRWFLWAIPQERRILLCGLLELTNGCTDLYQITDIGSRFVLATLFTGFGGFCVGLQTLSLLHREIRPRYYFPGKIAQAGISTLIAGLLTGSHYLLGLSVTGLGLVMLILAKFRKKTVAFPRKRVYNGFIQETRIELCSLEKR